MPKPFVVCTVLVVLTWTASFAQTWQPVQYANGTSPLQRHENGFVEVGGKFYLLGGRGIKSVNIFDPVTRIWTSGAQPPIELHHFQAVVYQNKIYAICAMTGVYPDETPVDRIYIYNPQTNTWNEGPMIPVNRRRGSAGAVLYNNKVYIACGIQVGHRSGWVAWLDEFDPATGSWTTLPDAPTARDHFHAGLMNGKLFCVGGRRTSFPVYTANTEANVDVYDIAAQTWSTPTQLPTPRGAPAVAPINNELFVIGGEVEYQNDALTLVESYNITTNSWTVKPPLNIGRHATQVIHFDNKLYIAAGSTTVGGAGENNTMALASLINAAPTVTQAYPDQNVPSTQTSLVISLNEIFNDDGGVNNLAFTVANNSNASLISNTQITGTQLTFTLSGTTGSGNITVRATDASNAFVEDVFQLTVTSSGSSQLVNVIRINSGGGAQNFGGEAAWVADQYFTGGTPYSTSAAISNTTQDQLYQSERYGNFSYAIPVPGAGTYAVDLHLAEIYFTTTGSRIFNINIENGQFVRNNLDLIQTIGSINQAYVLRADNLNVTDGTLNITFSNVKDNAKISGIAVSRYSSTPTNTPPVVVQAYPDQNVPSTQTSLAIALNEIFNDDGGVNNLAFAVANNSNAALISNTQIAGTQLTFTLSGTTGSGNITLRATDASNAFVEDVFQLTVTSSGSQLVNVIRINSGGGAQTFGGEAWVADQYFTGGTPYSTSAAISNTTQDQLYQSERYGNFSYAIPVPGAGTYAVDLHLAEIYFTTTGSRIFNINIENGQFVRSNLDLIQTIGSINQAYVLRADNLNVTDGTLNITFSNVKDNAKISGIAVSRYSSTPTNTPPVVVHAYPDQNVPSTQTSLVIALNEIFNDDGGVNNLTFAVANNSNAALISNTQIAGTQLTFTLSGTTGSGNITLRATDASNAFVEDVFQLTVTSSGSPQLMNVIRINSGGGAQNFGGEAWVADQYFTGGTPYSTSAAISNTTQDQVYQSERYGNFSYAIPVPGTGTYAVDLHLAEIYFTTTGSRIFNINIENGQFVRNNLDLIQTIGSINQAYVLRADNLNVTDGTLNISVTNVVNNAKLSGISVMRYSSGISNARTFVLDAETKDSPQLEKDETASFMVYPNPALTAFSIQLRAEKRSQWSVGLTDVTGRKYSLGLIELEEGFHEIPIDLQSLNFPNGIFVLSVDSADKHFHAKIMVVR